MDHIKSIWNAVCRGLMLLLLGVVPFTSCLVNDEVADTVSDTVSMQLNISAREEGDLNSRANEEGTNSEFMHHLCVLLVQDGKVMKKFLPDLSSNPQAESGNLRNWMSEPFVIQTGTYRVYAFANVNSLYSTEWSSLTGIEEEDPLPEGIDHIVLEDPVSKIDFQNTFIPMSAKKDVTITAETKSISIGLDRLVSKIRTTVIGKAGARVKSLSFGGYADRVALFSDHSPEGVNYGEIKNVVIPGDGILATDAGSATGRLIIPDFYVNSSPDGHPFQVEITTNEKGGATYQARTSRDELPRNSIFPLDLQLNYSDFSLEATCWVSPIGTFPVEVVVGFEPDTYEIKVPEGGQFAFTVGVNGGTEVTELNATWNLIQPVTGIEFEGPTSGVTTLKGHVTASAGKSYDLQLVATWKNGSASYYREYTVKLITAELTEFPLKTETRSADFTLNYLKPEIVNLFIK